MITPAYLNVEDHAEWLQRGVYWRVVVNGVDVTERCQSATAGVDGEAVCLVRNGSGHFYTDAEGDPVREVLRGHVEFIAAD